MHHYHQSCYRKNRGFTLMELIVGLLVIAGVVTGALSLYQNADSSSKSTQMLKDITAIRSAVQGLYNGQGGYGNSSLNPTLITGNKIPSTMRASGSTINTALGGVLTVTGNSTNFSIQITNVDAAVCTNLVTNSQTGWTSVRIGGSTLTTFPVTPDTAASGSNCGGTAPFTITWTTIS